MHTSALKAFLLNFFLLITGLVLTRRSCWLFVGQTVCFVAPSLSGHTSEGKAQVWAPFLGLLGPGPPEVYAAPSVASSACCPKKHPSNTNFTSGPEHAEINKVESGTAQDWVGDSE